ASAEATAQGPEAQAELRQQMETRAAKVSARAKARAELRIDAAAKRVDQEAAAAGDPVANRLASEFGMTVDALEAEKNQLGASWGQLMIAHTLMANATSGATVAQLVQLHADGMGWGQIAAGLGLKLGDVVSAVNAEQRVAAGLTKADGKAAVIHG